MREAVLNEKICKDNIFFGIKFTRVFFDANVSLGK